MTPNSIPKALRGLPEAFVSDGTITREVSRAVQAGKLRKLASRLYTWNLTEPPEVVVRRNLWHIVAGYFPKALIADRTALENAPADDGSVCLITDDGRDIKLPGITLRPRRGPAPLPPDRPFLNDLVLCSTARAYLENMRPSRIRNGLVARTLPRDEVEKRLDILISRSGKEAANRLREDIRTTGKKLDMEDEATELDRLIGALLGTREARLNASAAIARQQGRPYDTDRMPLFECLHAALRNYWPTPRPVADRRPTGHQTLAFYEAYFSNFIEGTEFLVDEAADIVFHEVIPQDRPEDAQDILGTWGIVSDAQEMARTPKDSDELADLLRARHAAIMSARPGTGPGVFKQTMNRAGSTIFVAPELVVGTLEQGFKLYRSLEMPFQRAVFIKYLIAEIHPFTDGNGRAARIMMNAELAAASEERIIIPTVYRDDYIAALNALSSNAEPRPLIRMLDQAQAWTTAVNWQTVEDTFRELESYNAFLNPATAEDRGLRLKKPPDTPLPE